jgi:hypothetical protein
VRAQRKRRHAPRHAGLAALSRDHAFAAFASLLGGSPGSARALLARIPDSDIAMRVGPAAEILAVLCRPAARRTGTGGLSPACAAGYCYQGITCEMAGCPHSCHARNGGRDDTVILPAQLWDGHRKPAEAEEDPPA